MLGQIRYRPPLSEIRPPGALRRALSAPVIWAEALLDRLGSQPDPNTFLSGNFGPVLDEQAPTDLRIEGTLPPEIRGSFLRVGPNQKYTPKGGYHLFDGDGMIHAVHFSDTGASYTNAWIQTHKLTVEDAFQRKIFFNIGELRGGKGVVKIMLNIVLTRLGVFDPALGVGRANTALVYHAGRLLALHEADAPYALAFGEQGQLLSQGRETFDNQLSFPFTAHPKIDPRTGELLFFGYSIEKTPYCSVGSLSPQGEWQRSFPVPMDEGTMMHDCAFTERYFILIASSMVFRPKEMVTKKIVPIRMEPQQPLRFGLIPRAADSARDIRWFDLPPGVIFHTLNAWEDGDRVVILACRSQHVDLDKFIDTGKTPPAASEHFVLHRFELDLSTGKTTQTILGNPAQSFDFPRCNPRFLGRPSRFGYLTRFALNPEDAFKVEAVSKVDLSRAAGDMMVGTYEFGPGCFGSECVYVPRSDAAEDDGYLLVQIRDEKQDLSYVDIIDARTMAPEPIARIHIPFRVPYGFHGEWISATG